MLFHVCGQDLRQKIGGRNRGSAKTDDLSPPVRAFFRDPVPELENTDSAFVYFPSLFREFQALGRPDQKFGLQLLLQLAHMQADRWLGDIELFGRPAETAEPHYRRVRQ